jgi:DNA polymerase III epsilon subunit-like protein
MEKLFCMMDTETTGLEEYHEIIEIGMILFAAAVTVIEMAVNGVFY